MFLNHKKKYSIHDELNELHQTLTMLSLSSMGPAVLYERPQNHTEILDVITLVTDLFALSRDFAAEKIDSKDLAELQDFDFFDTEDKFGMEQCAAKCLKSFPDSAQHDAAVCLNSIKLLYRHAALMLIEKLNYNIDGVRL